MLSSPWTIQKGNYVLHLIITSIFPHTLLDISVWTFMLGFTFHHVTYFYYKPVPVRYYCILMYHFTQHSVHCTVGRGHIDQIKARVSRRLFLKSIFPKDFRNCLVFSTPLSGYWRKEAG